jgi:hypothetical protein
VKKISQYYSIYHSNILYIRHLEVPKHCTCLKMVGNFQPAEKFVVGAKSASLSLQNTFKGCSQVTVCIAHRMLYTHIVPVSHLAVRSKMREKVGMRTVVLSNCCNFVSQTYFDRNSNYGTKQVIRTISVK